MFSIFCRIHIRHLHYAQVESQLNVNVMTSLLYFIMIVCTALGALGLILASTLLGSDKYQFYQFVNYWFDSMCVRMYMCMYVSMHVCVSMGDQGIQTSRVQTLVESNQ